MIGKPGVEVRLTLRQSCPGKAPRTSIVIARAKAVFSAAVSSGAGGHAAY